jgi:hypothetical protein
VITLPQPRSVGLRWPDVAGVPGGHVTGALFVAPRVHVARYVHAVVSEQGFLFRSRQWFAGVAAWGTFDGGLVVEGAKDRFDGVDLITLQRAGVRDCHAAPDTLRDGSDPETTPSVSDRARLWRKTWLLNPSSVSGVGHQHLAAGPDCTDLC